MHVLHMMCTHTHTITNIHTHLYISTYMSTSMHNTFCIADTHMCYVSWPATKESEEWPPAMREGKPRALRLRAVCMKSTLVLRDSRLKGKSRWCFEYRCSRQGDRMTKVPYTRHPSHTMSRGMNLLPFLPYSPFPSESLEKKEQIT